MKKNKLFLMSVFGVLFLFFSPLPVQSETTGLQNSKRLTDRILIVGTGEMGMDMVAAVNTEKGIVIIDTGMSPSVTDKHRAVIEKTFGRSDVRYVINTHHHGDHVNGNQVFKDAVIIAHENAAVVMRADDNDPDEIAAYVKRTREKNALRNRLKTTLEKDSLLYKNLRDRIYASDKMCDDYKTVFRLTLPTLTFTDHLTLHMGDLTIELVYFGPDFHSDGDILVSIPEEHTVFSGDIIFPNDPYQPVTVKSDIRSWISCLDTIFEKNSDIKHVVAYHVGILPGTALRIFYDTLKNMGEIQRQKKSAVERLREMISKSGVPEAVAKFEHRFVKNKNDKFYIWEGDFLSLSNEFREQKQYDDALIILKMYEKCFPKSSRPLYFQGMIFTIQGKKQPAIEAYRKMLVMDPGNEYYAQLIFQLKNSH